MSTEHRCGEGTHLHFSLGMENWKNKPPQFLAPKSSDDFCLQLITLKPDLTLIAQPSLARAQMIGMELNSVSFEAFF